jgi:adenosylcobinamide-phosphate synthase
MPAWTLVIGLLCAFAIDRWLGEPPARWHPVVWMGKYLGWIGSGIAPREPSRLPDWRTFWAGALAWYGGAATVLVAAVLLQWGLLYLGEVLAGLLLGVLLKPLLAWRMLRDEVVAVERSLGQSLEAGRQQLGRLVSREVMQLDGGEVRESAIESLAENFNDSVVAPVFWFVVAGLPGAAVYRFANTADAMWGYRGMRAGLNWEWAGKWAARADDVLSWIPARITALLFAAMAGGVAWTALRREAARTPSPNSGWPMAAMALVLGVRLRKPGVYALNEGGAAPQAMDTAKAVGIAGRALMLLLAVACAILLAWHGSPVWPGRTGS